MPSTKIYTLQNTGIPILYTFYYIKHEKNRSTLCVCLAVREILWIFHEYYDEISITCAIKKEFYALFRALDAAHSGDMSHGNELTRTDMNPGRSIHTACKVFAEVFQNTLNNTVDTNKHDQLWTVCKTCHCWSRHNVYNI